MVDIYQHLMNLTLKPPRFFPLQTTDLQPGGTFSATWPSVAAFTQHLVPWLGTDPRRDSFQPSRLSPRRVVTAFNVTLNAATLYAAGAAANVVQMPQYNQVERWKGTGEQMMAMMMKMRMMIDLDVDVDDDEDEDDD